MKKLKHEYRKEYIAWVNMRQRCFNVNHPDFPRWGGKGIKVCSRWVASFENFLFDVGPSPSPSLTIDRINNNGDYTPKNCRWATRVEQRANRDNEHFRIAMLGNKNRRGIKMTALEKKLHSKRMLGNKYRLGIKHDKASRKKMSEAQIERWKKIKNNY